MIFRSNYVRTGSFIEELLAFYANHRWIFIELVFPAVLLTTAAYLFRRHEVFKIEQHLPHGPAIVQHKAEIIEIGLLTWGSLLFSWLAFSLSFGAISVATEQIQAGRGSDFGESFAVTCRRLRPFIWLCSLLLALFVICLGSLEFGSQVLLWKMTRHPSSFAIWLISYTGFGLGALLCSRLSLSVPALILDDFNVGQALALSTKLTRGKWSILAVLLFKCVAGGYIAGILPFWLSRFIPASVALPSWFGWFLTAVSVGLVTAVEPIMFIGFALLYLKSSDITMPAEARASSP